MRPMDPPPEVQLTPRNLQLLFFERLHWVSVPFYKLLWESQCGHSVAKIFSCSSATNPPLAIHSCVKSIMQNSARLILIGRWSDSWDNWNKGQNAKNVGFVAGVSLLLFLTLYPFTPTTQANWLFFLQSLPQKFPWNQPIFSLNLSLKIPPIRSPD